MFIILWSITPEPFLHYRSAARVGSRHAESSVFPLRLRPSKPYTSTLSLSVSSRPTGSQAKRVKPKVRRSQLCEPGNELPSGWTALLRRLDNSVMVCLFDGAPRFHRNASMHRSAVPLWLMVSALHAGNSARTPGSVPLPFLVAHDFAHGESRPRRWDICGVTQRE